MQRLQLFKSQLEQNLLNNVDKNSITITDNRTGELFLFIVLIKEKPTILNCSMAPSKHLT